MRTALCLGGSESLEADIAAVPLPFDGVVACNDAGYVWPGALDAWVSLHPEQFNPWRARRRARGFPEAAMLVSHLAGPAAKVDLQVDQRLPGMTGCGSSGALAARVALFELGFDRVILCGIGLTRTPHFYGGRPWAAARGYRAQWARIAPEVRARMRSMSGWTRVLLGSPQGWCEASAA